jgi:putative transposase
MSRSHNRDAVFCDDEDRLAFLGSVARYGERIHFRVFHYCLMSDHIHLLPKLNDPRALSAMIAGLLRAYVGPSPPPTRLVGHRWQGRYKSPAVQCRDYVLGCGCYIERSSVAAGINTQPWKYRWLSACANALGEADPLLTESHEYLALSPDAEQRQVLWRDFLMGSDPREEAMGRGDWAIGDEYFRRRVLDVSAPRATPARPTTRDEAGNSAVISSAISSSVERHHFSHFSRTENRQ